MDELSRAQRNRHREWTAADLTITLYGLSSIVPIDPDSGEFATGWALNLDPALHGDSDP